MTPTYEGRQYTDPDDLLVDQGLQFDIATLMNRRGLLHLLGVGAGTVALAACAPTASSETTPTAASSASAASAELTEIPEETAGPYPGDGSNGADVLEQSGVVRSDIRSSFGTSTTTAEGVPMTLELTVLDLAGGGAGFAGVAVYVWHCTRDGGYSMYSEGLTGENFLRGVQIADADGKVSFTSIFPAAIRAGGRTSTSRSIPTRSPPPTPRTSWPPARSPSRRRSAGTCTRWTATRDRATISRGSRSPPTTCSATMRALTSWPPSPETPPRGSPSR